MKAFRASPDIVKDKPIFIQGQAQAPDMILPTTGEHVAYYGMFVLSKETAVTDTRSNISLDINGIPLGTNRSHINSVQGFHFFETSGDFTVASGSAYYFVRPSGILAYFKKGSDMVSGFVGGQLKNAGMPDGVFQDAMTFTNAQVALRMFCEFNAPLVEDHSRRFSHPSFTKTNTTQRTSITIVTATARIDSRVQNYMAGYNLPQGISDLITKRGFTLAEKDEVIVVEVFIPLNREVFVFGTFDGDRSIIYADPDVQLLVSYTDPETL